MRNPVIFLCGLQLWQSCCVRPEHDLEDIEESTSTKTKTGHLTLDSDESTSTKTKTDGWDAKKSDDGKGGGGPAPKKQKNSDGEGAGLLNIEKCEPTKASAIFATAVASIFDAYNAKESVKSDLVKTVETNSTKNYMTYGLTKDLTEAMYLYRSDLKIPSEFGVSQQFWFELINHQLRHPNEKFKAFCPYFLLLQVALSSVNKLPPSYVFRGEGGGRSCPKRQLLNWKWEGFTSTSPSISRAALFSNSDKTSGPGPLYIFKTRGTKAREITELQSSQAEKKRREVVFPPTRFRLVVTLPVGTQEQCQGRDKLHFDGSRDNVQLHIAKVNDAKVVCEFFDPDPVDCEYDCHKGRWYEMWDTQNFGAQCIGILEEVSDKGVPLNQAAAETTEQEAEAILGKAVVGSAAVADGNAAAGTAAASAAAGKAAASAGSAGTAAATAGSAGTATANGPVLHPEPHKPVADGSQTSAATIAEEMLAAAADTTDDSVTNSGWLEDHAAALLAVAAIIVLAVTFCVFRQKSPQRKPRGREEEPQSGGGDPDSRGYPDSYGHGYQQEYLEYSKSEADHAAASAAITEPTAPNASEGNGTGAAITEPTAPDASEGTSGTGAESSHATAVAVPVVTAVAAADPSFGAKDTVADFSPVPVVESPPRRLSPIIPPLPSQPSDATAVPAPPANIQKTSQAQ